MLALIIASGPMVASAQTACRHALVLALDVSGSVNAEEYALQVQGLAAALDHPEVRELILAMPEAPIALAAFEWSSRNHQHIILPWVRITDAATLDAAIVRIAGHRPLRAGLKTAMGQAMLFAGAMLGQQPGCWRRTIDVSGDGRNNIGLTPGDVYRAGGFEGVTVNALVVGQPDRSGATSTRPSLSREELRAYFEQEVIHGAGAFAIVARGYEDYARAMRDKLRQELAFPVLGALPVPERPL